jgi:hypothetical protein
MDYHHHARLTVHGLSRQSAGKWVKRYREGGASALCDRSSRPERLRQPTSLEQIALVEAHRRERWTGVQIAQATGLSRATVSRILTKLKLNRIKMLEPAEPVVRYEHAAPGDLLHIDIKKLARIVKAGHRITGNPRDETRGRLGVPLRGHRRSLAAGLYGDVSERKGRLLHRLPATRHRMVRTLRHPCPRRAHRQRTLLLPPAVRRRLPNSAHPPPTHQTVPAPDQRKGRTLHPNRPARMGLRAQIRNLSTATRTPAAMDASVQLASTTC